MLTAITLNKSNKIHDTINSILDFGIDQIILGTYHPFQTKLKSIKVIELKETLNYSNDINNLINYAKHDNLVFFKEGETIIQFDMDEVDSPTAFQILKEDSLIKENRAWNKKNNLKFKNPIFETLDHPINKVDDIILYQSDYVDNRTKTILDSWNRTKQLSSDCYYYRAFDALAKKNTKEFKSLISYYLFNSKKDISSTMARYYLAIVQTFEDTEIAIQNLILCLAENPLMAEFWCLLGDIHAKNNDYEKALEFYKNGKILGARRLNNDFWPMQMSKYGEYPQKMIEECNKVLESTKTVSLDNSQ